MKKLAIITTHPIQYNAPLFRLLSERKKIEIKVFYTWENSKDKVFDKKFGKEIKWDIPLLYGYKYTFVKNTSKDQGSHHRKGIINPTLNKEIEEWQADAVLIYGWNFVSHFKAMKYFKGKIPVYFRGDSTIVDNLSFIRKIFRFIALYLVYKFIDTAFYVGTNNKKYFLKYGLTEKQLIYAPHAIDNDRFSNSEFKIHAQLKRKELGYSDDDIIILFAGKFEVIKNPMLLINVARYFADDNQIKFLFVGNGELEVLMKKTAGKNIKFLPFQNQSIMPLIYNLCDIYCLPSQGRGETWGLAVNEAMACGKTILVSNKVGCAVDLVQNNINGYIFESENKDDLYIKIIKCKQKLNYFSENSRVIIENFSFEKIAFQIENKLNNE